MKDLHKMLMASGGDKSQPMSKEDIMAKMEVIRDLMEDMQMAMGGQVKGGLDEMLGAKPDLEMAAMGDSASGMPMEDDVLAMAEESLSDEMPVDDIMVEEPAIEVSPEDGLEQSKKPMMEDEDDSFFGKKKDKSKFR